VLDQAIATAVKYHAGQQRKGRSAEHHIPYVVHPIEVMKTVWTWGVGDPAVLAAAVLHDTLEDTALTHAQLAEEFGDRVAGIVKELTRTPDMPKAEYMARFATASVPALVVKLADRYCNTKDYLLVDPEHAVKYFSRAAVLVEAARHRLAEITRAFGEETCGAIIADCESLEAVLETVGDGSA